MARLSSYTFSVAIKHKKGENLKMVDGLSRIWTTEARLDKTGKVSHLAACIVRVPFKVGRIVSPADIMEVIQNSTEPLVFAADSPTITKATQTDMPEFGGNNLLEPLPTTPDLPSNLQISYINKSSQTGTREGIPNPPERLLLDDRRNITILSIKKDLHDEINSKLDPNSYIERQEQEFPELYQALIENTAPKNFKISNGMILTKIRKLWVRYCPPSLQNMVILRHHVLGHFASKKLIKIISMTDYWPSLSKDVKFFCDTCLSCLFLRGPKGKRQALGQPLASRACDVYQIDTVTGFPPAQGKNHFVSVVDVFSRFLFTFPLTNDRSHEIATNLERQVFATLGPCRYLYSDGASNMNKSERFRELCSQYNIIGKIRSPYSSRSLGAVERVHRTVLEGIRSLIDSYEIDWLSSLPIVTAVYNALPHSALGGYSPFEVMLGKKSPLFRHYTLPDTPPGNYDEVVKEHRKQLETVRETVQKVNNEYKRKMRLKFGGVYKELKPGQFIVAENKVPSVNERRKLRPRYYGPWLIHVVLDGTVLAEHVTTGKTSYLNLDHVRLLPEKPAEKFSDLPEIARQKCGAGCSYEEWVELWANGRFPNLYDRSSKEQFPYGTEGPPEQLVFDVGQDDIPETNQPLKEPQKDSSSSSSEDQEQAGRDQPINNEENRRVRFTLEPEQRRSSRTIKAPVKLDL